APLVTGYFNLLDNDLGIVYDRRKNYEQSVEAINELIGSYLDKENEEMQGTLPHYFERYKTDGVEYNQYVGQSLLRQEGVFSDLHLRNFRLWQLIQMCEITRQVESHRHSWPEPLTTAQLVFAYTTPLSIRFRMDEKRFDVDGAYNVRYEILKKRIDKAVIEGTSERITKSGHVTIVYLQEKDRQEYLQYADYLLYHGYIIEPPHDYELGALQGVQGLRALRMHVKL
ncbi:MAG: GAF domain-containing protein, partial [Bacteroidota bacterium]